MPVKQRIAYLVLVTGGFLGLSSGCTKYGGNTWVTLNSDPQGAEAYLIPAYDWDAAGGEQALSDPGWLEKYRVHSGRTPTQTGARAMNYIFVARRGGVTRFTDIRPRQGENLTFSVDVNDRTP